MKFQQSIIETIKTRTSSRTYDGRPVDSAALQKLTDAISEINASERVKGRFLLAQKNDTDPEKAQKLGTYGVIAGATSYLVGTADKSDQDPVTFGYLFETIVLYATELGIQTCWLGGTFKKDDFEKSLRIPENETIVMVSPLGYRKGKRRLFESAMRAVISADKRKAWNDLFFDADHTPLTEVLAGGYAVPLEMVRLGPSASNKQPWRIIRDQDRFDFFLSRTKGYGITSFDMQMNDMGIAKCHFELSAKELGLSGNWEKVDVKGYEDWEYAFSWVAEA
ncbi:MAG: nitroreductase family protein [Anaerofustis sp.]